MVVLEANGDGAIVVALSDDSEIEITVIELEGNKSVVVICADDAVSVLLKNSSNEVSIR